MEQISVKAYNPSEPEQVGTAQVRRFTPSEITKNILRALAIFWGLAAFTALIPGLHFILTPGFFIFGIYQARRAQKTKLQIQFGDVPCPKCKEPVKLKKADFVEGHIVICQHCVTTSKILLSE
jgi:hypothetical protein